MIRSKLPMEDNLFKSLRGVTISTRTELLLDYDMWGEIEIIWQKDKVVASRPRTAKCPRQHTTSCTMGASRAHTVHSPQNICVGHPIRGRDNKRPFSTITRSRKVVQRPTWPPEPRIWPTGLRRRISHKIISTGYYGTHHYSLRVPRLGISDDEPCRDTKRALIFFFC